MQSFLNHQDLPVPTFIKFNLLMSFPRINIFHSFDKYLSSCATIFGYRFLFYINQNLYAYFLGVLFISLLVFSFKKMLYLQQLTNPLPPQWKLPLFFLTLPLFMLRPHWPTCGAVIKGDPNICSILLECGQTSTICILNKRKM